MRTNLTVAAGIPFPAQYIFGPIGTAYFLNKNGGKESNRFTLTGSFDEDRIITNSFGTSFLYPDSVEITAGGKYKMNSIFGIGPNLPADIVPNAGTTLSLFGISLASLAFLRR